MFILVLLVLLSVLQSYVTLNKYIHAVDNTPVSANVLSSSTMCEQMIVQQKVNCDGIKQSHDHVDGVTTPRLLDLGNA